MLSLVLLGFIRFPENLIRARGFGGEKSGLSTPGVNSVPTGEIRVPLALPAGSSLSWPCIPLASQPGCFSLGSTMHLCFVPTHKTPISCNKNSTKTPPVGLLPVLVQVGEVRGCEMSAHAVAKALLGVLGFVMCLVFFLGPCFPQAPEWRA